MKRRDNIRSLYLRNGYDCIPAFFVASPQIERKINEVAKGQSWGEFFDYPEGFGISYVENPTVKRKGTIKWEKYYDINLKHGTKFDDFGIAHEPGSEGSFHMTRMHHPGKNLTSIEDFEQYPWPDYELTDIDHVKNSIQTAHEMDMFSVGVYDCTIWERSWYFRDMTVLMMDMAMHDPKASWLFDTITDIACRITKMFAKNGCDLIILGDDIGMQNSIMMSVEMYREWLLPRHKKVCDGIKKCNPDCLIQYHSCGYIEPFIPSLLEAGIDILNPIQPESMSFKEIYSKYGDQVSFNGTIGTQTTMPFGTPLEVRDEVWKNLDIAGPTGGLLPCPTHLLEPEVPLENIMAYVHACRDYIK